MEGKIFFFTCVAVGHNGAIEMFWLPFWGTVWKYGQEGLSKEKNVTYFFKTALSHLSC